ncbi:cell division protein FtsB [Fluviicoccus keumensis]|uniref:Cell division protein FtsB n=1 Tax=Fluviicoccus keumensis TaxID=1435465 RepID=A0A4Q7Z688_9GAMM|nr:cell division protein FtsB [Fluviicoccus keumensis]RZU45253.1 cell division protein FtsB [Fluviicoccus keumensis]
MLNSMFGRMVFLLALLAITWLQSILWMGEGGIFDNNELAEQIKEHQNENRQLAERNRILDAEVRDLKQGMEAVEEHARLDLGMIKNGETFVRVTRPQAPAAPVVESETR